ncbi:MAG: pantetheine-phosphate adenylyltransferase [Acidobacteria bacterium]|nr:pantetheine-phosphate adenylyltransferase [Acidobacteriota bacterium]
MTGKKVIAIYPGSFDPVTFGHLDIIKRCLELFDTVIAAILVNKDKQPLFSPEERLEMMRDAITDFGPRVETIYFDGLLVEAARQHNANVIIRGIRAVSDYEYELQMALMNRKLAPDIETVFLVPDQKYSYLSSRLVKEVFSCGCTPECLVPDAVARRLIQKYNLSR